MTAKDLVEIYTFAKGFYRCVCLHTVKNTSSLLGTFLMETGF